MGLFVSVRTKSVYLSVKIVRIRSHLNDIRNVKNDVRRLCHLPLNGVVAKIALRDLDLLFKVNNFKLNICKTVIASAKMCGRHKC